MKRLIKRWTSLFANASEQEPLDVDTALRNLRADRTLSDTLSASVTYGEQSFKLLIDPDDQTLEECLTTARKLLETFQEANNRAQSKASESLLKSYNEDWREYSEMRGERYEGVSKPELKSSEFEAILKIDSVAVIGQMVQFYYADNGLFAGHSVVVTSFDGLSFTDSTAELFG